MCSYHNILYSKQDKVLFVCLFVCLFVLTESSPKDLCFYRYGGSRMDTSYNPMAQGQGGQSNLPSHFSQGSWPGDMRDHTSSGSTSPHHHDNQPHYGSGHPHNPNNYR